MKVVVLQNRALIEAIEALKNPYRKKVLTGERKETKSIPIFEGKSVSSSSWSCTQVMRKSIYLGAEHLMGFLMLVPSAQWYSYLQYS